MKKGFVSLFALLVAVLLMVFLFIKIYTTKSPETQKTQLETYKEDVQKTESIKNVLEKRSAEGQSY